MKVKRLKENVGKSVCTHVRELSVLLSLIIVSFSNAHHAWQL